MAHASGEPDAFALNGVGARPAGMGGAFVGLADDIEAVYYNPAGLGNLKGSGFTAMYQTPSLETSRGFLAYDKAWNHHTLPGSAALGWLRLQSGDIELTNTDERVLGSDTLSNDLLLLAVGVKPFERIALGVSVKYVRFSFNGFSESGLGFDLGAHAEVHVFRFGLALTDVNGTTLRGSSIEAGRPDASDEIPMRLRPGMAVVLERPLRLPIDIHWLADQMITLKGAQETRLFTGLELWGFHKRAALRGGYQEASGPTLGAGVRIGRLQFDYAYLFSLHLQDENRLGLTLRF
ncbi:MAG: hypothetical protein A2992_05385 [Elusimicrobia bacterium RIFCSPLOWO2_01_FULL_59_12]|nr:MAG: hypothetical protein A2992_05385 [Elusimicrobia bacterium RIFCSPLOWO2_01_FULL_59_12]